MAEARAKWSEVVDTLSMELQAFPELVKYKPSSPGLQACARWV